MNQRPVELTMNGESQEILEDSSYTSYEVNGTRFVLQNLEDTVETLIKVGNQVGTTATSEEQNGFNSFLQDSLQLEKEEDPISLVCLDGQIFAFHNGNLQELDLGSLIDGGSQEPLHSISETSSLILSKDLELACDDILQCLPLQDGLTLQDDKQLNNENQFELVPNTQAEKNILLENQSNVNANDFVEVVTAFKCKICPYTSQDREQLLNHLQNVHVNPAVDEELQHAKSDTTDEVKLVYMCGECSNCFATIEDCRVHMINDHQLMDRSVLDKSIKQNGTNSVTNEDCGLLIGHTGDRADGNGTKRQVKIPKALNSEYMLNKKTIEIKGSKVKCTYRGCPYKFSNEETMRQHAACHIETQNGNSFKCNICKDEKFAKWRPCSLHLWKKHQIDIDLLTCKICKAYKSVTMMKLLTHMRVHSESREYECPECGKCFKQPSQMRNHRIMHIDRKSTETPRWYTSKTCEICGKIYADSKCLKNHIQAVHSKLRPYVCNVCGHSSARKAMLQMHLRQHTGDKPFNCELCDYKTGDHNSLRRHIMRHTGVRPYKCPHCPYSAIQSNSYKNHLRSKHPLLSGLFTCELCPFKTVKKESYVQHVGDHEKGLIKASAQKKDGEESVEVFPGNIAAAQLIYSCLGAFSKVGKTIEANLMSSSTSADGTSQTITIQIPSKHLEGSLPTNGDTDADKTQHHLPANIEPEDDETMHCFLKIPREEEENIDTGGITIPAELDTTSGSGSGIRSPEMSL